MAARLTREDIVGVAIDRLASGGLHALGMRQIATDLGVQQSALYWHFENKQQLLAAVADQVVAPVAASSGADWSTRIEALASQLRSELRRYPDGAELVATAIAFRLGAQRPFRQFADELAGGGVSIEDAEIAASVLLHFVLGYVADEQQHDQAAALGAIEQVDGPHSRGSADEAFHRGIRLIVTGIGAQMRATPTTADPA